MAEQFIDTIDEPTKSALIHEISFTLFDNWANACLDEGEDYAEREFMIYASPELQQQYNEYYGYKEGDEYYL